MKSIKFFHLSLVLAMMWALPALSQVVIEFPASNDCYVHNLEPNISFGSETSMLIGAKDGAEGSICHSYVQFDMAGYDGDVVQSAILRLYATEAAPAGSSQMFSLYLGAGDSWSEDTITWNNAPGFMPGSLSERTSDFQASWVSFDVTDQVASASEVGGKVSFAVVQNTGSWISFTTSEWTPRDNQRPILEIRFEGTVPAEEKTLDSVKALYISGLIK